MSWWVKLIVVRVIGMRAITPQEPSAGADASGATFFMQMRDGKVVDVTTLTDSISLNELLERVQPAARVDS
jgi:predicted secreted protein